MDDIAERVTALGGTARGTAVVAASESTLAAYPLEIRAGNDHVEAVSTALAAFGKGIREAIATAGEIGDAGTEDLRRHAARCPEQAASEPIGLGFAPKSRPTVLSFPRPRTGS